MFSPKAQSTVHEIESPLLTVALSPFFVRIHIAHAHDLSRKAPLSLSFP